MIGAAVQKKPLTPDKCQCCGAVNPQFPTAESPFCVGCDKRNKCNAQSPLSGYEPVYMPSLYNKKAYVQHNHNCFAYAFDIMDLPTPEECNGNDKDDCKVPFHQPGYASGQKRFDESGEKRCFDLLTRLKSDMPAIEIARNGQPIKFTDTCAKGYSKIALVIDPKQDYHFYRQDSNGFWSHKPGGTAVTNKDSAGRLIYNPELANRDNRKDDDKDGLNYNVFCGFMCVPRTLPNRAKRGGGKRSGGKRSGGKRSGDNGKHKTRRRVRGGMVVTKQMLPWLRKTQRLVGGMNNMEDNGNPNANGYNANKEVPRKPTKSRKAARAIAAHNTFSKGTMAIRTMMAIVNELKRKYPDIVITKEDEKALRAIARESVLPKYSPRELFRMIQIKYGKKPNNATEVHNEKERNIASEVRTIFREAHFLPKVGATTSKAPRGKSQHPTRGVTGRHATRGKFGLKSKAKRRPTRSAAAPVVAPAPKNPHLGANRARRIEEYAKRRAAVLLEAAREREEQLAAAPANVPTNPVDAKVDAVLDIIQHARATPAEVVRAITFAEHLREAIRMHAMPPPPSNPLEASMADMFGALESAAANSSVVPTNNNNNNVNVRGSEEREVVAREDNVDYELAVSLGRLGI